MKKKLKNKVIKMELQEAILMAIPALISIVLILMFGLKKSSGLPLLEMNKSLNIMIDNKNYENAQLRIKISELKKQIDSGNFKASEEYMIKCPSCNVGHLDKNVRCDTCIDKFDLE